MIKKSFLLLVSIFTIILIADEKLLPTDRRLVEGELKNGFKYTILKNRKPKNRAEFRLIVKIGSLDEDNDQRGVAHFVEHMAFNGTKHFKKNELIKYLESIGVKFGAHLNASTGYETTTYMLTVPLEKDNLEKAFLVFEDWASGITFDKGEFDKERGVILEEARVRDSAGFRIYNKSKKLFYGDTKYMERLPIGEEKIIKNISVERAKQFYRDWYRPKFMHFIAVGDFNTSTIQKMITQHFSKLKNVSTRNRASREIPDNNRTRVMSVTDKELTDNYISVSYVDILEDTRTKSDLRKGLIELMMMELFNMKAGEQILKLNPKASSINLVPEDINSKKSTYTFNVNYNGGNGLEALGELYELLNSFQKYGFSKTDFEIVKRKELEANEKEHRRVLDLKSSTIASQLVEYALHNSIYIDYEYEYKVRKELLKAIKLEEINRLFRKVMGFQDRFILFVDTDELNISHDEVMKIVSSAKVKNPKDVKKLPSSILNRGLKPTKIVANEYNDKTDIYGFILENGIRVAFKHTDFSKDRVVLVGFSFGGSSLYSAEDLDSVRKASTFVDKSGAGEFTNIDLSKILAGKDIHVGTAIYKFTEEIYGYSDKRDIESMFQLLHLKLNHPTIDKRVEENQKRILKFQAQEAQRNPQNRFSQELSKWFQKDNPRVIFDTPESIERLNGNSMLEIYRDRFADINNFNFVIVGDINVSRVEELITKYFGELPTLKRDENFIEREIDYRKGKQTFVRYYNNQNISNILILYKSSIPYSKKNELLLNATISILNVRLRELIREEKSGVYGVNVVGDISKLERNQSSVTIQFSCDPMRRKELISYIHDSIKRIKEELVTDKELEVYKKKFKVSYETDIKENDYWIDRIVESYTLNTPLDNIPKIPSIVEKLSREDIRDIANRLFGDNVLQAELNPR